MPQHNDDQGREGGRASEASRPCRERRAQDGAGATQGHSLGEAARRFVRHPSPWCIGAALVAVTAVRVARGSWAMGDLVVGVVILALEPFTEWVTHVFLLHGRYGIAARKHVRHHLDPTDEGLVFVPLELLLPGMALAGALVVVFAGDLDVGLSGLAVGYAMLLTYEWTHFLIHTRYRPRHRYYRSIWRSHRLHHFRNEHYWYGVTITLGDRILRTHPQRDEVPLSPTARTLGQTVG